MRFHTLFDIDHDPKYVYLELSEPPRDYSGKDALGRVAALYAAQGKELIVEIAAPEQVGQSAAAAAPSARQASQLTPKTVDVLPVAVETVELASAASTLSEPPAVEQNPA